MQIRFKQERYGLELLPSILVTWHFEQIGIYFGWLLWNVSVDFLTPNNPTRSTTKENEPQNVIGDTTV